MREKKQEEESKGPPPPPDNWNRCHAYIDRKKRFCRQMPTKGSSYCGNHLDYAYETNKADTICPLAATTSTATNSVLTGTREGDAKRPRLSEELSVISGRGRGKDKGKRIPCPLDPSHTIYESNLKAHIKKCNKAKQRVNDRAKIYYKHGLNQGGFGLLRVNNTDNDIDGDGGRSSAKESNDDHEKDEKYYQNLALAILRAYHHTFIIQNKNNSSDHEIVNDNVLHSITKDQMYNHIPYQNYYPNEKEQGLENSLSQHRIKIGGPKHMEQIGSIVGHVKEMVHSIHTNNNGGDAHCDDKNNDNRNTEKEGIGTIIEMGAGRATTGFVVASVIASHSSTTVNTDDDAIQNNDDDITPTGDGDRNQNSIIKREEEAIQENKNVKLILVERSGSRGKADRAFRRGQRSQKKIHSNDFHRRNDDKERQIESSSKDSLTTTLEKEGQHQYASSHQQNENQNSNDQDNPSYMNVDRVEVQRIKCDLAHVHLPTVLEMNNENQSVSTYGEMKEACDATTPKIASSNSSSNTDSNQTVNRDILVIAKHCCGCGTDLALKSLLPIKQKIQGVILTTCCHGICNWNDFVGRNYLRNIMMKANRIDGFQFGEEEFDLMKRWACGTVIGLAGNKKVANKAASSTDQTASNGDNNINGMDDDNEQQAHHLKKEEVDHNDKKNITYIVKSMDLDCGLEGLGRACQRLIDYGRIQFMEEHLFDFQETKRENNSFLCHYVNSSVTPQNALLKGHYCGKRNMATV